MTIAGRCDIFNRCRSQSRSVRRRRGWFRRWLLGTVPMAAILTAIAGAGPAFAQSCDTTCIAAAQVTDQENLLDPFLLLPNTPAGQAVLQANLMAEDSIYLNSTQVEKIASGTILIAADIPANLLIRAFPGNPNYGYNAAGLPGTASPIPTLVTNAVADIVNDAQLDAMKPYFGKPDIYGTAYGYLPGQSDTLGNSPPYQVSAAIANNPFTAVNSSALAAANQQDVAGGVNWQEGDSNVGNFPSGHTLGSSIDALTYAILAPGDYQQLMLGEADFSYDLNVYGVHYPLDIIGGRIMATYVIAQMLAGNNPIYPATSFNQANLAALSAAMQGFLQGGSTSPYAAACAGNVAGCIASGVIPIAASYEAALASYDEFQTYGLPSVGDTTLAPVVPDNAYVLIATRFPYLSTDQLNEILYTTELPSGGALDNGTGWARLNLYAASSGYGAFLNDVTVNMNSAHGGLNAFDIWSNDIIGPGGLTLQGSGTLILAGNDSYAGGTTVQGGTLGATGSLGGNLTIWSGANFVGNGAYAVASGATLINAGTFTEVNTPLVNAGTVSNTGTIAGDVNNTGTFTNNGLVTGTVANAGELLGNGTVGSLALLAGSTTQPGDASGTIYVVGNLTVAPGATYQVRAGPNGTDLIAAIGTATLTGGTVVITGVNGSPALGSWYPILTAAGGVSGSFNALTESARGIATGTRFDMLYGPNTISLVLTPDSYGRLTAVELAENASESTVGAALDAIRPAPGVAMGSAQSALFDPLYILPASGITTGLDELAPSIYADGMMAARDAWYLMADALGAQLTTRRGLAADKAASSAPGPNGSTIWFSGLAGYDATGAGSGSPGFSAALGGAAAGIDVPVAGNTRIGAAVGTVEGQSWSPNGGQATNYTAQFATYGQWRSGIFFAEAQLDLMVQQENVRRTLPLFGAVTQGNTEGVAGGGGITVGVQENIGAWLIEPTLGFGGFDLQSNGLTESAGGALTETIGGAALNSAESTLALSAQRVFMAGESVSMTVKGRLGWSHEFADDTARTSASFSGLSGSGFTVASAPIGRDAALVGLGTDIKVASWPVTMFVGYGGALNTSSSAQSLIGGVRFIW